MRFGKIGRAAVAVALGSVVAFGGQAAEAQAAVPWCTTRVYYNAAVGGCNGNFSSGSDRLWVYCQGLRGLAYWKAGPWHNRYADWQDWVLCDGSNAYRSTYAYIQHSG